MKYQFKDFEPMLLSSLLKICSLKGTWLPDVYINHGRGQVYKNTDIVGQSLAWGFYT